MPTPGYVFRDSGTTPPANEDSLQGYLARNGESNAAVQHEGYATGVERHVADHSASQNASGITSGSTTKAIGNTDKDSGANGNLVNRHPTNNSTINGTTLNSTESGQAETVPGVTVHQTANGATGNGKIAELKAKAFAYKEHAKDELDPDGHDIARRAPPVAGAAQAHQNGQNENGVRDIGWHRQNYEIPDPLIGDLPNGELFARIRRFNKDVFAVKQVPPSTARGIDLNESWSKEYATDKLTLNFQRVYLSIVLGMASFLKQVARLRSWKETQRTGAFLAVYTIAWLFDFLIPLTLGVLIAIVSSNRARNILFPPAPLALVNVGTGGLQKPQAGQLGTTDTLSGAPESQVGEAKEEEAAKIVNNIRHIIQKIIGMHEEEQNAGDPLEGKIPKPIRKGVANIKAAGTSSGHATGPEGMTEGPMEQMIWEKANPEKLAPLIDLAPHAIGEIVDNWERFENAIFPTPPFNKFSYLRLDGVLAPLFLASFFINSYMVYKGTGAAIGFALFGDPIITPAMDYLNRNYPNWMQLLEPKNNILRGVPTHAQLTLTLLRIGEINHTPLPPVPKSKSDDPQSLTTIDPESLPIEGSDADKMDAINPSPMRKAHSHESGEQKDEKDEPKHKHLSKIARVFKGQTKAAVDTKLAVDRVRAAAGSETAKGHLGVLPKEEQLIYAGPTDFKARYKGKKGWIHITTGAKPTVVFTTQDKEPVTGLIDKDVELSIAVEDIYVLKRAAAFSNKVGQKATEFSEDRELLAALEIQDANEKTWRFTALPERDELFNRLVAMGSQRWVNV